MLTYYNNYVPLVQLKTINMPRQARKTSGTGIYHVMLRGINRQGLLIYAITILDKFTSRFSVKQLIKSIDSSHFTD